MSACENGPMSTRTILMPAPALMPHQAPASSLRVDGYGFELLASEVSSIFNDQSHAVSYAGYLFRQGRERPNDLTALNRYRWHGLEGSADGTDAHARASMTAWAGHLSATWERWVAETVFVLPLRPAEPLGRLHQDAYGLVWDVLEQVCADVQLDMAEDLWVSHLDQATPPHLHRVHDHDRLTFHEVVAEAARTGRIGSLAGPMAPFVGRPNSIL